MVISIGTEYEFGVGFRVFAHGARVVQLRRIQTHAGFLSYFESLSTSTLEAVLLKTYLSYQNPRQIQRIWVRSATDETFELVKATGISNSNM